MLFASVLLSIALSFLMACDRKEVGDDFFQEEVIGFETFERFLIEHQSEVLDIRILEEYKDLNSSTSGTDFIHFYNTRKRSEQAILDSISIRAGLEVFRTYTSSNPEHEALRLYQITNAYGKNEVLVVNGVYEWEEEVSISKHVLKLNEECTPLWMTAINQDLRKECFDLISVVRDTITLDTWNELRGLIIETDFWMTSYSDNSTGIFLCHGPSYHLEAARGESVLDRYKSLSQSCPGNQTAIYLIAEKLLSFID